MTWFTDLGKHTVQSSQKPKRGTLLSFFQDPGKGRAQPTSKPSKKAQCILGNPPRSSPLFSPFIENEQEVLHLPPSNGSPHELRLQRRLVLTIFPSFGIEETGENPCYKLLDCKHPGHFLMSMRTSECFNHEAPTYLGMPRRCYDPPVRSLRGKASARPNGKPPS